MDKLKQWWFNDLPIGVKIVFLLLLANAVPAIIILTTLPTRTEQLFVWTINPVINVRLMAVMYANALIMVGIGFFQPNWARVRIVVLLVAIFSVMATLLTFVYLKPFLAHPWYHLTYWLGMYLALFFVAPTVFVIQEKEQGGRLPVQIPLNIAARLVAAVFMLVSLACAFALLFRVEAVNEVLPWTLPPLVGGLIGVLFTTHTFSYAWALWDGDWLRTRPMFWQAPPTALLFLLLPLLHSGDLRPYTGTALTIYCVLAAIAFLASLGIILSYRSAERELPAHG